MYTLSNVTYPHATQPLDVSGCSHPVAILAQAGTDASNCYKVSGAALRTMSRYHQEKAAGRLAQQQERERDAREGRGAEGGGGGSSASGGAAVKLGPEQGTCDCPVLGRRLGLAASAGQARRCGLPRFRSCTCCPHNCCLAHTVEQSQEPVLGRRANGSNFFVVTTTVTTDGRTISQYCCNNDGELGGICACCESEPLSQAHWRCNWRLHENE